MTCDSLSAALYQAGQRADAVHVDELGGKGGVGRQLGQLLQGLQARIDAVRLDPVEQLPGRPCLRGRQNKDGGEGGKSITLH